MMKANVVCSLRYAMPSKVLLKILRKLISSFSTLSLGARDVIKAAMK